MPTSSSHKPGIIWKHDTWPKDSFVFPSETCRALHGPGRIPEPDGIAYSRFLLYTVTRERLHEGVRTITSEHVRPGRTLSRPAFKASTAISDN